MALARLVNVTPKLAAEMLDTNVKNRPISPARVQFYAQIMRDNRWRLTGDSIVMSDQGRLMNGQHRLTALVEVEQAQPFVVLTGVPENCYEVMDQGQNRTLGQMMKAHGVPDASMAAAASRLLAAWLNGAPAGGSRFLANGVWMRVDPELVHRAYVENSDKICRGIEWGRKLACIFPPSKIAFVDVVLRITRKSDDDIDLFWSMVDPHRKVGLTSDHPCRVLADYLTLSPRARLLRCEAFYPMVVNVFNAFAQGQTLAKVSQSKDCEVVYEGPIIPMGGGQ